MYKYVLVLHILSATIWTGGHLVLALALLPQILRERSVAKLLAFESAFEKLGMSALAVQVASGLWLAYSLVPEVSKWFTGESFVARLILLKLTLLALTLAVAMDARLRVIPALTAETLPGMALRIRLITLLSVAFVIVGATFRTGPWW